MKFAALTIFPEIFDSFIKCGIIGKALSSGKIGFRAIDIREFAEGRHKVTDDRPFGGGSGMVMKPEPLLRAIKHVREKDSEAMTVLLSPQGTVLNQKIAANLAQHKSLIFVCGRYEGVDERVCSKYIDFELSIGDYVINGGETAAMVVIEAVVRLLPKILGNRDSAETDSLTGNLLKHAQYTRPSVFEGIEIPETIVSGDHKKIEQWRLESSLKRTFIKRPDLLENRKFSGPEIDVLEKWQKELTKIIGRHKKEI